jgi:5'-methylthioadenosine phosphorylase
MTHSHSSIIGILGGSGLYDMDGLANQRREKVRSSFGEPSDELCFGELEGVQLVFLPRHGRGHHLPPSEINFRANIDAMKRVGVTDILSVSAVGSLNPDLSPGTFVIVDQFIDRTFARNKSFFESGLVAHVSMAHPVCARLGGHIEAAAQEVGIEASIPVVRGGTYLAMEGPQFSSRAESELYRSWGCDVIGMTNMPEAKLAREAEICYATIAMVTDFDCWHPDHDNVTVEAVIEMLQGNAHKARSLISLLVPKLGGHEGPCAEGCQRALEYALITAPDARSPELALRLDAVAGRVLGKQKPTETP